jgi:magnesium chelatase subunit D
MLEDVVLQAAAAAIPAGLLAQLQARLQASGTARSAGRAGAAQQGGARGRPIASRRGEPRGGARLDLMGTLRAAAPWQAIRGGGPGAPRTGAAVKIRADDFRVRQHRQRQQTTTLFVVDASGSQALNRLAEAKGAVELLLADCYVRRDSVALLAFRGRAAELLLPPTRSLVRAKRSLAALPGGGGTPLAAGLDAAAALADSLRRRGQTPLVVLLTDGRANVARDGTGGRARAEADALTAARELAALGVAAVLVDTASQPQPPARQLAAALRATYLALPHAGAAAVSRAVQAVTTSAPGSRKH